MKFSEQWLREWIALSHTTEELSEQLTMLGLEVDTLTPAAPAFDGVYVGEVESCVRHPDAERLHVCTVNVGRQSETLLSIVCGAGNVRPRLKVAVAMIGATLPNPDPSANKPFKIKKSTLRGQLSQGMLCSEVELGLAEKADGIMALKPDAPIGTSVREYLQLDDTIIDIELTANRGDCASLLGIARELAAVNQLAYQPPIITSATVTTETVLPVCIQAPDVCPHYLARVISHIQPDCKTPLWLQEKLRRSGMRSIHPIVDICNYVMLELGQPLHSFDFNKLKEKLVVRFARDGESLILLDNKIIMLDQKDVVIADTDGPVALAGIMGGLESATENFTDIILLESAYFQPERVMASARKFRITSDAAYRFARGVDPTLQEKALERASALLLDILGGQAGPIIRHTHAAHLPAAQTLILRQSRIQKIIGISIPSEKVLDYLTRLEMHVTETTDPDLSWKVTTPLHRFDLKQEIDLIEEVARLHGFDQLPSTLPSSPLRAPISQEAVQSDKRLRWAMVDEGYSEVINYSFIDEALQRRLDPDNTPVALAYPISSDMSVMRTSLWPGLLKTLRYNQHHQQLRARLFETGLCFLQSSDRQALQQQEKIAGLLYGSASPEQWGVATRNCDFFDLKGTVELLLRLAHNHARFDYRPIEHPALHPQQTAAIEHNGEHIGWLGALHPKHLSSLELQGPVFLFEMSVSSLKQGSLPQHKPVSKYPWIRRDLAFIVDNAILSSDILNQIHRKSYPCLKRVELFDLYKGEHIDYDKKSIAIACFFQHDMRTLTDKEVESAMSSIVQLVKTHYQALVRE